MISRMDTFVFTPILRKNASLNTRQLPRRRPRKSKVDIFQLGSVWISKAKRFKIKKKKKKNRCSLRWREEGGAQEPFKTASNCFSGQLNTVISDLIPFSLIAINPFFLLKAKALIPLPFRLHK